MVGAKIKNADIKLYTGIPPAHIDKTWHMFWNSKKTTILRRGGKFWSSQLRYHKELVDGTEKTVPREKGVDVRIALDILHAAMSGQFETVIVVSHDQDLAEAVADAKRLAAGRPIEIYSAFPSSVADPKFAGRLPEQAFPIKGCAALPILEEDYFACLDTKNHFPHSR